MNNGTHTHTFVEHNSADRVPPRATWPPVWLASDCPKPVNVPVVPPIEAPAAVLQVAIVAPSKLSAAPAVLMLDDTVDCPSWDDLPDDQLSTVLSSPVVSPGACTCGFSKFLDTPIHDGRTVRRDCARCGHTRGFPVWHGVTQATDDVTVVTAAEAATCRHGYTAVASFAKSKWHARQARRLVQQDYQQEASE